MRSSTVVIGIGNVLMGDDGVGPCVVRLLEGRLPDIDVVDCGTAGLDVSAQVLDRTTVVFVDAVAAPDPAGTVVTLRGGALREGGATGPRMCPHEPGIRDALLLADLVGRAPTHAILVGVVPANTELGTTLTPAVAQAVCPAARAVIEALVQLGHPTDLRQAAWLDARPAEGFFAREPGRG